MAELPEIAKLTNQMEETLKGKEIGELVLLQEKCTNVSLEELCQRIIGGKIQTVKNKGKWMITSLDNGESLLLSLGMGADVLYFENEVDLPEKYQIKVNFTDETGYTIRFWWFGKFLICKTKDLSQESATKDIAIDPWDNAFTLDYFKKLLAGKRTQVKSFLLNQKNISGIGNMYIHDILFKAGLHPQKKISDLKNSEIESLYKSILEILNFSKSKGSFAYESDFFGQKGGYNDFIIGYKEDENCPICGNEIVTVKTGSTKSYLCLTCQPL
ncbi:DNA-formamidopyrimidine glycosylase family protein [Lactococcus sp.]|uniref:DNA-formamidopyrimidine glycosylase family protein n=1 Tax=Lactococcus sp. TaxID=44273 RepID=UPI002FC788E6